MKSSQKLIFFWVLSIFFLVLVLEILLSLSSLASPKIKKMLGAPWEFIPADVVDYRLGKRPSSNYPEHDAKGFRNSNVLDQVDIIALGDSQTYGTGVKSVEAWPHQLELLSGKKVYNMAFGGYGPT